MSGVLRDEDEKDRLIKFLNKKIKILECDINKKHEILNKYNKIITSFLIEINDVNLKKSISKRYKKIKINKNIECQSSSDGFHDFDIINDMVYSCKHCGMEFNDE